MEVEKRSSKGGFFQLFDWNTKSRKKLFSNKSELRDSSRHGSDNVNTSSVSRLHQMTVLDNGFCPSARGSDNSCSSSISNDEPTKAPGVVARLMGLESLPNSNIPEQVFNSQSFRDYQSDHEIIGYSSTRGKLDGLTKNPVEHRLPKFSNHPMERFQSETLPSKSAKAISSTHRRLLSPIKSPGFVLSNNPAHVMEAAARIIDQSPQSMTKSKFPSVGSPSVPLKIRDLKERMEAARQTPRIPRKPKENISLKYTKGSQIESENFKQVKNFKKKDKLVSPAVEAKAGVKQKEEPASSSKTNRKIREDKESKQQQGIQKGALKVGTCDVLRQNNQKQNTAATKQRESKAKKPVSPLRENKSSNMVNSTTRSRKNNTGREVSSSKAKNLSKKKQSGNEDVHSDKSIVDEVSKGKNEKSVICNFSSDGCPNWDAVDVKSGMDVVSFTFTSPIKKSVCGSQSSDIYDDQTYLKSSSSMELNVIDSDALSLLLEQKLKELTSKVESNSTDMSTPQEKKLELGMQKEIRHVECTPFNGCQFSEKHELQGLEEMEEQSSASSNIEYGKGLNYHTSPISIGEVESSFTDRSCNSSDTKTSITFIRKGGNCFWGVSSDWELEYIRDIINTAESVSNNALFEPANRFIEPDLFDHLENQLSDSDRNMEEYWKLERKVLFDCVSERMEFIREQLFGEGFKSWNKWTRFFRRTERAGDELFKEISGWASMGELMVDELVEKDMSSQIGKWVEFEIEEFEEGVEIEEKILNILVEELVVDLFLL